MSTRGWACVLVGLLGGGRVTFPGSAPMRPDESSAAVLAELVAVFVSRRPELLADVTGPGSAAAVPNAPVGPRVVDPSAVRLVEGEVLRPGRPGLLSLVADVDGALVHVLVGLRGPGDASSTLPGVLDGPLGLFADDRGLAMAFDALDDGELSLYLVNALLGNVGPGAGELSRVRPGRVGDRSTTLVFDGHLYLTVFERLVPGSDQAGELQLALEQSGSDRLPRPLATWTRSGRELAVVQETRALPS